MANEQPTILIDFKKSRIRIHKSTLRALNNPSHIMLLVNPIDRLIAVKSNDGSYARANLVNCHVPTGKCFEIYSTALLNKLRLWSEWDDKQKFRMSGQLIDSQDLVQFRISDSLEFNNETIPSKE